MNRAKSILSLLLTAALVLSLFACAGSDAGSQDGQKNTPEQSQSPGQSPAGADETKPAADASKPSVITIGATGGLGRFLDAGSPQQNISACDAVYDSLFLIDPATKQPYSHILESWEYVDDLTFVMTLKPGITFTNGDEATAEDLLFSVMQHIERSSVFVKWLGPLDVDNCTIDGEYTVTLRYTQPYGPGIWCTLLYLFDKSWCAEKGWDSQDWYSNPNGTGPYIVSEYFTDDHMTLKLKDDYWNAANESFDVETWVIRYYPDASTMTMAFERGDIAMCSVGVTDYERLRGQGEANVGLKVCAMGANMNFHVGAHDNEIFNDINVREAIAYGVDWSAIGQLAMGELYEPATSSLVKESPYYLNVGAYPFDQERARQVMEDAGYKQGDVKIHIYSMPGELYENLNEALQFYLQDIGITVDLEFGDVTSALAVWREFGGSDVGWFPYVAGSLPAEPHHSWAGMYNKSFTWQLSNEQHVIDKCLKALYTVDQTERTRLYHELQQIMRDEFLIFPVYEDVTVVAYNNDIFTEEEIDQNVFSANYLALHGLSRSR